MSIINIIGNAQDKLRRKQPLALPGSEAFNQAGPSIYNNDGRIPYGVTMDLASNLPKNPKSFNDYAEEARLTLLSVGESTLGTPKGIVAGAAIGAAVPIIGPAVGAGIGAATFGLAELDKKTDGKVSKALLAGAKNVRSNYAFVNDISRHDAGMGMLAGLQLIAGGVLGGVAGFALAGPVGAVAGFGIGSALAGKASRDVSQTGMFGEQAKKSANFAESEKGQKLYNFGTDVTRLAGEVVGIIPGADKNWLKDTDRGIGAITAGLFNFGFEVALAPDIKTTQLGGSVARTALVGGVTQKVTGPASYLISRTEAANFMRADKLEATVDILNRTAKGEKTNATPMMEFFRDNDVTTIFQHPLFKDNPAGLNGANLIAGKNFEQQSLIMRIGLGDKAAIKELETSHPATFAQLLRLEGVFDTLDARNPFGSSKLPQHDLLQGRIVDAGQVIEAEIKDLRGQYSWLDKALKLDSALTERTFSRFEAVEKFRIDQAKQRSANKMGGALDDISLRSTKPGQVIQKIYQLNNLSVPIRFIERNLDDAPHATVNFNDPLQSITRVRTTMRESITKKVLPPLEARELYSSFARAKTETEKLAVIKKIEERVFEQVANKYGVPSSIKDAVLDNYIKLTRRNTDKAKSANSEQKAYMIEDGEVIRDAQLISQLANGAYLVDVALIDKAFSRFAKKRGAEVGLPINTAIMGKAIIDEFNSIWRTLTLARIGFPINIIRDSTLRTWGDGVLLQSFMNLSKNAVDGLIGVPAKMQDIRHWSNKITNRKSNLDKIREDIKQFDNAIKDTQDALKRQKYDPANPPKEMGAELQRLIKYDNDLKTSAQELRRQENAIIQKIPSKVVGEDKINVIGYDFPAPFSGRFGEMSYAKIRGKDDIRGAFASVRELELDSVRRDRDGGRAIRAVDDEDMHLRSWDNVLNNILRNDEVSREIMARNAKGMDPVKAKQEVVAWIQSSGSRDLFERWGYDDKFRTQMKKSDAGAIYDKSLAAINQFAPDALLQKMIIENKVNIIELKKMYPEITKRPDVISDLALDLTGQSTFVRNISRGIKDFVTTLATLPPAVLSYAPYFSAKYELKLQSMVALANSQGRKLSEMNQKQFEATAREYALAEYRAKINAFSRDMNYNGALDYMFAFFPAVVEQYRAYGRLTMEHPEFPQKIMAMGNIPSYIDDVQVDQYGTEYVEVTLPVLGIVGRLPVSWFNAINPTGGHILSASPLISASYNKLSEGKELPKFFSDLILPFGTQANTLGALTPSTVRRFGQFYQAYFKQNGPQYNKDMQMFIEMKRKDFEDDNNGSMPSGYDMDQIIKESEQDAKSLSAIRFLGSGVLPAQPRYVTPLEKYADLLGLYQKQFGADGAERFSIDYPEYYMIADKTTDSTSGINQDATSLELAKRNPNAIRTITSNLKPGNLSILGAVFNGPDYEFSSSARAWMINNTIPGTNKRFIDESDAIDSATSSIVNKGWRDWNKFNTVIKQKLAENNLNPASGYGKSILDAYKDKYMQKAETENNLWYKEKTSPEIGSKRNNVIDALTIAANTPELWKDLAKQPRWHTIVDYLNFRYYVKQELETRGASITSDKAVDIRGKVETYVAGLISQDVTFSQFYDRYLDGDEFNYVHKEVSKGKIK
jgi:hypothetical protein